MAVAAQDQQSTAEDLEEQGKKENRSSSTQVLIVRTVEKLLDGVSGRLKPTAWNALLGNAEALAILQVRILLEPIVQLVFCDLRTPCSWL